MVAENRLVNNSELACLYVHLNDTLKNTLELFRQNPGLHLLAVLDHAARPVGVIRETDVRALLFNPFGHALMCNPSFGQDIGNLVRECAMCEENGTDPLHTHHHAGAFASIDDSPGLILMQAGKFKRTVSSDELLNAFAENRVARADEMTGHCETFTAEIMELSSELSKTAQYMQSLSTSLDLQATSVADAAHHVAVGASQSSVGLQDVNERGRKLAFALEQLADVASEAKTVRTKTQDVIAAATPQMASLADHSAEIRSIVDVIRSVGRATNFLALNAQIEAVRQSQENSGFVAVANEIKVLAATTRGSADEVTGNVDRIGKAVGDVLIGHRQIVDAMECMNDISGRIEFAVEEQSTTSLAIAGFVEQAASASHEISAKANDIGSLADNVQNDARELGHFATILLRAANRITDRSSDFVRTVQFA